ncbi:hypothetical protein Ciccas_004647 [Cichlidogyrus casuarinus]|uniref:Uncharacterized protein n=1 Tax=Cichlidogyrus casuarinus TaxID=1844966 RepID=A0ABD2QAZ4_9PLAT
MQHFIKCVNPFDLKMTKSQVQANLDASLAASRFVFSHLATQIKVNSECHPPRHLPFENELEFTPLPKIPKKLNNACSEESKTRLIFDWF